MEESQEAEHKKALPRPCTFLGQAAFPNTDHKVNISSLPSLALNSTLSPRVEADGEEQPKCLFWSSGQQHPLTPVLNLLMRGSSLNQQYQDPYSTAAFAARGFIPLHPKKGSTCQQEELLFSCHHLPSSSLPVSKAPQSFHVWLSVSQIILKH